MYTFDYDIALDRGPTERIPFKIIKTDKGSVLRSDAVVAVRYSEGGKVFALAIELPWAPFEPHRDTRHIGPGSLVRNTSPGFRDRKPYIIGWTARQGRQGFEPTAAARFHALDWVSDGPSAGEPPERKGHLGRLLQVAEDAIAGRIRDINVRRDGSAVLLNAGKDLIYTGFSPEAELLKGLIVAVDEHDIPVRLVAGCLPKFYNAFEDQTNDAMVLAAMEEPGTRLVFTMKQDGSNLRPYTHPDTGEVEFATRGMLQVASGQGEYLDFCRVAADVARRRAPALLDEQLVSRYTFVCELIHPDNRIITDYGDREDLVLLAVIELATGRELRRAEMLKLAKRHGLTVTRAVEVSDGADLTAAIEELQARWAGTDEEGCVLAVEGPSWPVPYRLKIKGKRYLELARLARACTLRRTVELAETFETTAWPEFRARLLAEFSELSEEVLMGYRDHLARYRTWDDALRLRAAEIINIYEALPTRDADQKTFAISIAAHPERSSLFLVRKLGPDEAYLEVLAQLRRAEKDTLKDTEGDEDLAA